MAHRRGQLPRDLGLQLRMGIAMLISAALLVMLVAALVAVALIGDGSWAAVVLLVGIAVVGATRGQGHEWVPWRTREPTPEDTTRLEGAVSRLALTADLTPPSIEVVRANAPLSWTTALRPSRATIHVTTGLLDALDDRKLEAVVGHELGHLASRDAIVMTVLAGPPASFLQGMLKAADEDPFRALLAAPVFLPLLGLPAALMLAVARIVSRHREFTADRAAALFTGSPASVAAALVAVDDGLTTLSKKDLRVARGRDSFHFVPARRPRLLGWIWASHPRTAKRLERLEKLEANLQRP